MVTKDIHKIKVDALRTIAAPEIISAERQEKQYRALVSFGNLPDNIKDKVNPRDQKMTTNVAKSLISGVVSDDTDFYLNNRGIVISAKNVSYDSNSKILTLDLGNNDEDDNSKYGILDGGHTYRAIKDNIDKVKDRNRKFVQLEIITGIQALATLNAARNSSVSVTESALANLDGKLEFIKNSLNATKLGEKVAYRGNEEKPTKVTDLVRLMIAMNPKQFSENDAPTVAYNGLTNSFKRFEKEYDQVNGEVEKTVYYPMAKNLVRLVDIYEHIEKNMLSYYNKYKNLNGQENTKFGAVNGITKRYSGSTSFTKESIEYGVSSGYVFPMYAAFRALLDYDEKRNELSWKILDIDEFIDSVGPALTEKAIESHRSNPNLTGKDPAVYKDMYRIVKLAMLEKKYEKLGTKLH